MISWCIIDYRSSWYQKLLSYITLWFRSCLVGKGLYAFQNGRMSSDEFQCTRTNEVRLDSYCHNAVLVGSCAVFLYIFVVRSRWRPPTESNEVLTELNTPRRYLLDALNMHHFQSQKSLALPVTVQLPLSPIQEVPLQKSLQVVGKFSQPMNALCPVCFTQPLGGGVIDGQPTAINYTSSLIILAQLQNDNYKYMSKKNFRTRPIGLNFADMMNFQGNCNYFCRGKIVINEATN